MEFNCLLFQSISAEQNMHNTGKGKQQRELGKKADLPPVLRPDPCAPVLQGYR